MQKNIIEALMEGKSDVKEMGKRLMTACQWADSMDKDAHTDTLDGLVYKQAWKCATELYELSNLLTDYMGNNE